MLHSIEVAFIFPFSSSSRLKVRARSKYGAGCPSFQHAAHICQLYSHFTKQTLTKKCKYKVQNTSKQSKFSGRGRRDK